MTHQSRVVFIGVSVIQGWASCDFWHHTLPNYTILHSSQRREPEPAGRYVAHSAEISFRQRFKARARTVRKSSPCSCCAYGAHIVRHCSGSVDRHKMTWHSRESVRSRSCDLAAPGVVMWCLDALQIYFGALPNEPRNTLMPVMVVEACCFLLHLLYIIFYLLLDFSSRFLKLSGIERLQH